MKSLSLMDSKKRVGKHQANDDIQGETPACRKDRHSGIVSTSEIVCHRNQLEKQARKNTLTMDGGGLRRSPSRKPRARSSAPELCDPNRPAAARDSFRGGVLQQGHEPQRPNPQAGSATTQKGRRERHLRCGRPCQSSLPVGIKVAPAMTPRRSSTTGRRGHAQRYSAPGAGAVGRGCRAVAPTRCASLAAAPGGCGAGRR